MSWAVQLQETMDRFKWGESTMTDVAQARARLSASQSDFVVSQSNLRTSIGVFRQQIGHEPRRLEPVAPIDALLPTSRDRALLIAEDEHPAIIAALRGVEAQRFQVGVAQSDLYPNLSLQASSEQCYDVGSVGSNEFDASLRARLYVPVYEGGLSYSRVRQAKETLVQQAVTVDIQRDAVRSAVISSYGQWQASGGQIQAVKVQLSTAETALAGVREELKYGQRTTLDVLNAQQELLNARVALVSAQRDRVVNSYAVLSGLGRLDAATLNLQVPLYDPKHHYEQVRDLWFGLRTPDHR